MQLLSADYNQVELRVLAHVAGEDVLREIFASGEDVHRETAAEVLGDLVPTRSARPSARRRRWSTTGSRTGSRLSGWRTGLQISREEAATYIERYFERFPAVKRFIDETIATAEKEGFVYTLLGRRRAIPELRSSQRQRRSLGERLAVNTVIQGTAADIIKLAMVRCHAALAEAGLETRLVLQIHDELLFEGPEAEMDAADEARPARDVRGVRARSAAGGRRRHRRGLADRQVAPRRRAEGGRRPPSDTSASSAELLDELDLLERGLPVRELQVGLVDDRVRREVGGGAVLAVALAGVVVVSCRGSCPGRWRSRAARSPGRRPAPRPGFPRSGACSVRSSDPPCLWVGAGWSAAALNGSSLEPAARVKITRE